MFLIAIKTVPSEFQQSTIVKAGGVGEAWSLGLRESWLALHFFPQGQNLFLVVQHALLVHMFQPQFLQTITVGILSVKQQ